MGPISREQQNLGVLKWQRWQRWIAVIVVLGQVRGIQYDECNGIPTAISPKCDLGKKYVLDDYQGKVYSECSMKTCPTAIMADYDINMGIIDPYPFVYINRLVNFTCR